MPTIIDDKEVFTLLQVNNSIRKTLAERYKQTYWITAEMIKLNFYHRSGHCYPDLVQKQDGVLVAQVRSVIWKKDFDAINKKFLSLLHEPLKDGIKILFQSRITFDAVHGLSLNIIDIDPGYTLGDLEKEKQQAIIKLKEEGIYNLNKTLRLPMLPKRIAIISVETSKGYADFLSVIDNNRYEYKFFHHLFPSLLQGDQAVPAIINQLNQIKKVLHHFDVVAIIRGGGGDTGLSCYNNYHLAKAIATFPIPVITGIGHATNETVAEMISFSNAITPTKIAEFLIQKFNDFAMPVQRAQEIITDKAMRLLNEQTKQLANTAKLFRSVAGYVLIQNSNEIATCARSLSQQVTFKFKTERQILRADVDSIKREVFSLYGSQRQLSAQLLSTLAKDVSSYLTATNLMLHQQTKTLLKDAVVTLSANNLAIANLEKNVQNMSPENVLKRGYSITYINGKAVKNFEEVQAGAILNTTIFEGTIDSQVLTVNKPTA